MGTGRRDGRGAVSILVELTIVPESVNHKKEERYDEQ
jgi:hypothetical protein